MSQLLALLHLCDSLFPIGGFGYSEGLEAATSAAMVTTADDLGEWMKVCLDETIGCTDGPILVHAWRAFSLGDWETLVVLDAEASALRPSSTARRSSRAMGSRLATTWHALYPDKRFDQMLALVGDGSLGPALPVAFACAAASAGVGDRDAASAFAYVRLAATISSAMRLMSIGQTDAHTLLARALDRVPAVVETILVRPCAESFAPAMDVALMTQQYLHSRLFRS